MSLRKVYGIDQGWLFKQDDDPSSEFLPVSRFPTNVHLDLLHHKLIPDPNVGNYEEHVQWIGEKSWVYRTELICSKPVKGKAILAFDGLDTYSTVRLNGDVILKTENMFIPERVNVTGFLSADGPNILEITFDSTYLIGKKIVKKYPSHYWGCWNGDPSRLAGWDWGPTLLTCGPWRPITLEVYDARISDLSLTTNVHRALKTADIVPRAEVEGDVREVMFEVSFEGKVIAQETVTVSNGVATTTLKAQSVNLWYPHTYGDQPLYLLTATALYQGSSIDTCQKRFGLRRAEVIQRKLSSDGGTSFFFEINNIAIFCGGSGWIPADSFIPRIPSSKYRDWVRMAVDGNQIMLRVWGGGIYEEQAFYDTCDEMGMLVWQDFMFACGNYPAHPEFLDLVKREAAANIRILRHHPSIVIFAGNNEDYQYCETEKLGYDPNDQEPKNWLRSSFPSRYIYEKILSDLMSSLAPNIYYHFGSPYGGKTSADPMVGDIHQWNVWHGTQQPYQNWSSLSGHFITEFGMQGLPCIDTIDAFLPQGAKDPDRYALSSTLDFHNKADGHVRRLAMYMDENLRYEFEPLEMYIYYTQLMQAECLSSACRSWKRKWKPPGGEACAGALVWQLNDCWPGTSWAIADYHLRPKLAYYAIKRELQPVTIGVQRTVERVPADNRTGACSKTVCKIYIWAVNLSLEPHDVEITIYSYNLSTQARSHIKTTPQRMRLSQNRSTELTSFSLPIPHEDAAPERQTVFAAYLIDTSGKQLARAINWPEPLKWVHFPRPEKISIKLIGDGMDNKGGPCAVIMSADVCIKALQLEFKSDEDRQARFEDNGIDLVKDEEVRIGCTGLKWEDEERIEYVYAGMGYK